MAGAAEPRGYSGILGILACAFALRLYKLDLGLWYDEVLTYVGYARMPFGEILTTYNNENQHFVFTLLAHACFVIFGEGAWALRLPGALFGVASIWALYLFARQVGSTRQALFAAALFTFSYHHIWFSQNARGYSGLLFWVLLSSYFLLRAHAGRPCRAVAGICRHGVARNLYAHHHDVRHRRSRESSISGSCGSAAASIGRTAGPV